MTEYSLSAAPWSLLFTQGSTVTLTLSSAGATGYTVTDVYGTTYSGTISLTVTSFTPTPPSGGWPNGWYSVDVTGPSGYYASSSFVVVTDDTRYPAIPEWGAPMNAAGQLDQPLGHYLGFRLPSRLFQRTPDTPATDITYINEDLGFMAPLLSEDPVRQTQNFVSFGNGGYDTIGVGGLNLFRRGAVLAAASVSTTTTTLSLYADGSASARETYTGPTAANIQAQINNNADSWLWASDGAPTALTAASLTALPSIVTTAVQNTVAQTYAPSATAAKAPMVWFEGPINEPSGSAAYVAASSAAFIEAVHTTAGAQALVPTMLQPFAADGTTTKLHATLMALKALGVVPNGISIHPYNMIEGDLAEVDQTFPLVVDAIGQVGWLLPLFGTENGDVWLEWVSQKITRALHYMALWLMAAECYLSSGKETMHWFYDQSHGFNYFSWWINGDNSLIPIWPLTRTWTARLYGTTFQERYTFPGVANRMFIGARWTDASHQTILILPAGLTEATVTLGVTGTTRAMLFDWADTPSPVAIANGKLTYTATRLGTWVVLPIDASVTIADVNDGLLNLGPNMASPDHASTVLATSSTVARDQETIYQLVGDDPQCGDRTGIGLSPWMDHTYSLPSTITMTPATPCRADRVVLLCPPPYFTRTAPTAFTVEYLPVGSTTWTTLYTETNATATGQALPGPYTNMGSTAAPTYRTTYDGKCQFDCSFDPVVGQAFRIVVTATSFGGEPDATLANACLATNDVPLGPPSAVQEMFVARFVGLYCHSAQVEATVLV